MSNFTHFRTVPHSDPLGDRVGMYIVEIWNDTEMLGVIYPSVGGIKLVSKYLKSPDQIFVTSLAQQPVVVTIKLK